MGFSLSGSQLLPLLSGRRAHQSQLSHFLAFRLEAKKRIVAVSLGIYVSQPMSSFRSIKQKCQRLWTCSFIPPSPKLLAQQKKIIRTDADVEAGLQRDCCSARDHNLCLSPFLCAPRPLSAKTFQEKLIWTLAFCSQAGSRSSWLHLCDQREREALQRSPVPPWGKEKLFSNAL